MIDPSSPRLRQPAHRVSSRAVIWWTLQALGGWLALLVPATAAVLFVEGEPGGITTGLGVLAVLAVAHILVMPTWRFRVHRWEATRDAVYTQSGWLNEPLLLRAGGGASCTAVATGSGGSGRTQLLPPAPRAEAHRVAATVLREANSPTLVPLRRHPRAALRRRLIRAVLPALAMLAGLGIADVWLPSWPWQLTAVLLVPGSVLVALDRYRNLGHAETVRQLVAREGSVVRQTVALQHQGIIGWKIEQSIFQRRAGIATVTATTAAGSGAYRVLDVELPEGLLVADSATPGLLSPFLLRG